MNEATNAKRIESPRGRLSWAIDELERSTIHISAMSTSIDALLYMMHERTPGNQELDNLQIWLSEMFRTECGILEAVKNEMNDVYRGMSEGGAA